MTGGFAVSESTSSRVAEEPDLGNLGTPRPQRLWHAPVENRSSVIGCREAPPLATEIRSLHHKGLEVV
jgi:hypothetical protein